MAIGQEHTQLCLMQSGGVKRPHSPPTPEVACVRLRPNGWKCSPQMPVRLVDERRRAAAWELYVSNLLWTVVRARLTELDPPRPYKTIHKGVRMWGTIDTVSVGNALFPCTVLAAKYIRDNKKVCLGWAMTGGKDSRVAQLVAHYCLTDMLAELTPHTHLIVSTYRWAFDLICSTAGSNWRATIDALVTQLDIDFDFLIGEYGYMLHEQVDRDSVARRAIGHLIKKNVTKTNHAKVQNKLYDLLVHCMILNQPKSVRWVLDEFDAPLTMLFHVKLSNTLIRTAVLQNCHAAAGEIMNWVKAKADPNKPLCIYGCLILKECLDASQDQLFVLQQVLWNLFDGPSMIALTPILFPDFASKKVDHAKQRQYAETIRAFRKLESKMLKGPKPIFNIALQ
jgi:hypothetical protein